MPDTSQPSTLRGIMLLLFRPAKFVEAATGPVFQSEPNAYNTQERRSELCDQTKRTAALIRNSLATSLVFALVATIAGLVTGVILRSVLTDRLIFGAVIILQLAAAAIILGATLSLLGWEIQTYSGNSLPEKLNRSVYRFLYVLGTYLIVVSLVL